MCEAIPKHMTNDSKHMLAVTYRWLLDTRISYDNEGFYIKQDIDVWGPIATFKSNQFLTNIINTNKINNVVTLSMDKYWLPDVYGNSSKLSHFSTC